MAQHGSRCAWRAAGARCLTDLALPHRHTASPAAAAPAGVTVALSACASAGSEDAAIKPTPMADTPKPTRWRRGSTPPTPLRKSGVRSLIRSHPGGVHVIPIRHAAAATYPADDRRTAQSPNQGSGVYRRAASRFEFRPDINQWYRRLSPITPRRLPRGST